MPRYKLYAGLGGGFGGAYYQETVDAENLVVAETLAYEAATECYESYAGMHGLNSTSEIKADLLEEDPDLTEEELESLASDIYQEEMESWLDYYAEEEEEEDLEYADDEDVDYSDDEDF